MEDKFNTESFLNTYGYSEEEWQSFIKVLSVLSKDPFLSPDTNLTKTLITKTYKTARKTIKKEKTIIEKKEDAQLLESTHISQLPENSPEEINIPKSSAILNSRVLKRPKTCYTCKNKFNEVHFFYHALCPECAIFNYRKRSNSTDLKGRTALITGGRIKIGFQTALKLLRDQCKVIITTRFPNDAFERYKQEADFDSWKDYLIIYGLDLRNINSLEAFIKQIKHQFDSLDIIINNAAQTISRPKEFYEHLFDKEESDFKDKQQIKGTFIDTYKGNPLFRKMNFNQLLGNEKVIFPVNSLDAFNQQIDKRQENSWVLTLDEVDTYELIEAHIVNSFAPFILNSKLKPLLLNSNFEKKFIVNVSAMEGQFSRENKTKFHPHTNMAKAGMNMMTRTSASQYKEDNIFMNSVDTGWITQEHPYQNMINAREKGFIPPLDIIDGAARVYDPIVLGLNEKPVYGKFLKDYKEYAW